MNYSPQAVAELADIVRSTAETRSALTPVGAGTQLDLGNPPTRGDAAIELGGLNRIVEYAPEDQVIVVEAGMRIADLQAHAAKAGQRLAIDPAGGQRMSVGGLLATNAYGPSALRYGTAKDLLLGIEIVRADGVVAHAGGKVVKNVAGFDLSKMMVGSLGTLGIITKASFRMHPMPESRATIALRMGVANVFPFVLAMRDCQLEPSALAADLNGGSATLRVTFEGFEPGVAAQ
ncbi:MAG: FAD-binding oxidoreductase, partial [Candidatus Eremiobacteraeota bacterium]|nr:FAD-binding oxidoreductase [Candidatus Eremiobacteraeota bacterium]